MSGSVVERRVSDDVRPNGQEGIDQSAEARARRMGWYPKDEYRGRPEDWIDAEAFVERAEKEMPILRSQLRSLDGKLAGSEAQARALAGQVQTMNQRLEEAVSAIDSMRELTTKAEQRGFDRAMESLKKQAKEAAAAGDAVEVERIVDETKTLIETRVKPAAVAAPEKKPEPQGQQQQQRGTPDPVIQAWAHSPEREWYRTNLTMNLYAQSVFQGLVDENSPLSTAERLAEVEREVMAKYPTSHHWANRQRPAPRGQVDPPSINQPSGGDHGGRGNKGSGFDALPKEAKDEYKKIAASFEARKGKTGYRPYTKEEFLKAYNGE